MSNYEQPNLSFSSGGWNLESNAAARLGTDLLRHDKENTLPSILEPVDIFKASNTWLMVQIVFE